jgi:hypothetical protein
VRWLRSKKSTAEELVTILDDIYGRLVAAFRADLGVCTEGNGDACTSCNRVAEARATVAMRAFVDHLQESK